MVPVRVWDRREVETICDPNVFIWSDASVGRWRSVESSEQE